MLLLSLYQNLVYKQAGDEFCSLNGHYNKTLPATVGWAVELDLTKTNKLVD
jgi:hypothetical protein